MFSTEFEKTAARILDPERWSKYLGPALGGAIGGAYFAPEERKISGALGGALGGAGGLFTARRIKKSYNNLPASVWDKLDKFPNWFIEALPDIISGAGGAAVGIGSYEASKKLRAKFKGMDKEGAITGYAGNQASRLFSKTVGKTLKHNPMRVGPKNRIGLSALNKSKMNFKTKPPTGL